MGRRLRGFAAELATVETATSEPTSVETLVPAAAAEDG